MFDHLSIGVADLDKAMRFYDRVLAPLGIVRLVTSAAESDGHPWRSAGYGEDSGGADDHGAAPFWLEQRSHPTVGGDGHHLCFAAATRAAVDAFHAAGIAAGGRDNGAPGMRPHYQPAGYYAAFLIDPDGWKIEAVTFQQ